METHRKNIHPRTGADLDSDLEVAFRKHSCYVRDTNGVGLLKGSRGSNLYTISVEDMMKSSLICLLSEASKNKSWLWHRRLNHLNFGTINDLARKDLVRGLPRLKFEKDHLCSACQLGSSKNTNLEVLNTLHMDLCGPMLPRTPQQNGVVERRNRTLIEAARTMLIFSKAPMFLWAEAVATACYTQNCSLIHTHHDKAPVLQILWGVVNRAYIDYAERIFTKLIIFHLQWLHNFHPRPESLLHLPTEEPVLGHLKFSAKGSKREVFGMTIPNELINDVIRGADYYDAYLEKVVKHQRYIAGEELSDPDSPAPKPVKPTKQAKPKAPKQTKPTEPKAATKKSQPAPAIPQENDTGKLQPLPE
ncbi:integrase, catalytic region, zinc finger, CCHC-type containing protein, partial [Tanacetum coccineum]